MVRQETKIIFFKGCWSFVEILNGSLQVNVERHRIASVAHCECAKLRGLRGLCWLRGLEKLCGSCGTWVNLRGSWVNLRGSWVLLDIILRG